MPPFIAAFLATFIAEMGDKTQLVTLTMACRCPPRQVFIGAMAALGLVTGMGVAAGGLVSELLPPNAVAVASGIFFIFTGIFTFLGKESSDKVKTEGKQAMLQTFGMIFLAEMGDKTQLTALALTAAYGTPWLIFTGAMTGQALNHGLAAFLGSRYLSVLPKGFIRVATLIIFLVFGLLMLYGGIQSMRG